MKKLLSVLITAILITSCNQMFQDEMDMIPCDTVFITTSIQYGINNNDRESFGGSPDVWAAAVKVKDSAREITLLFTDTELKNFTKRFENNLTDTINK